MADYRPDAEETHLYLCNAGSDKLTNLRVATAMTMMLQYHRAYKPEQIDWDMHYRVQNFPSLAAGEGILVGVQSHIVWELVHRYRISWADIDRHRWRAEVYDLSFNAERFCADPNDV